MTPERLQNLRRPVPSCSRDRNELARPDLPLKIISALAGDKVSGECAALLGYNCAAAPGEAFRAEHDLACYRVKRPEELNIAIRTPDIGQVVEDAHMLGTRNRC
jgi:hypothetical protein